MRLGRAVSNLLCQFQGWWINVNTVFKRVNTATREVLTRSVRCGRVAGAKSLKERYQSPELSRQPHGTRPRARWAVLRLAAAR